MESQKHKVQITQIFDMRKYGPGLESTISESTNRVASSDRVNYSFFYQNTGIKGSSSTNLTQNVTNQKTKTSDFDGSEKVKANVMKRFQYLCWKYVAQVMDTLDGPRDSTQAVKLRKWKRLHSHTVICQSMAMAALESEKYRGSQDRHVLTSNNIKLKLVTWEQDFRLVLSEHMHAEEDSIVHPHPLIGFQPPQNSLPVDELTKRHKAFDPWFHGLEYCLPALATLFQVSRQVFLDDRDRKNTDGTTMLLGEAGSGKSRLLKAVVDKFNGYLWQKKVSNFQSKSIETKSVVLVDEFDSQSLQKEQIHNEWKQRFDQEQSAYCDRKGVPGSNCTKHMPFFVTTNTSMQWFKKNYDQALRRRILFIQFTRSHAQFEACIDISRIPQKQADIHEEECILSDQIANTVLLLGLFRPETFTERQFYTEPILSYLALVVINNINSPLIRVLGDPDMRKELYSIIQRYTTSDQFIAGLDHQGIYQQLYKPDNSAYRLLRLMGGANGVFRDELDFQMMVKQLQRDPFRDLGQYLSPGPKVSTIDDPFLEKELNNPHVRTSKKLMALITNLPQTDIALRFHKKVQELIEQMNIEDASNDTKPISDEEYDSFFKADS